MSIPAYLVQYIEGGGWPLASQLTVSEPLSKTAVSVGSICQNGGTAKQNAYQYSVLYLINQI